MKKRILALAMAAVMAGSLTACSGSSGTDTKAAPAETEAPASESKSEAKEESKAGEGDAANTASSKGGAEGYELALVTDLGTIDDKSFRAHGRDLRSTRRRTASPINITSPRKALRIPIWKP